MEGRKLGIEAESKQNELIGLLEDLKSGIDTSSNDYDNLDRALLELAESTREIRDVLVELRESIESEDLKERIAEIEKKLEIDMMQEKSESTEDIQSEVAGLKNDLRNPDVENMTVEQQIQLAEIGRKMDAEDIETDTKRLAEKGIPFISWLAKMANK